MASTTRKTRRNYYTPQPVRLVPGLVRLPSSRDTFTDIYRGTADALIASGICTADMLPPVGCTSRAWRPQQGPKNPARSAMYQPGYLLIARRPDGSFRASLTVSEDEQRKREHAQAREDEALAREDKARAQRRAQDESRKLAPMTPDEFRERAAELLITGGIAAIALDFEVFDRGERNPRPFRFSPETFEQIRALFARAVQVLKTADLVRVTSLTRARADSAFQSFLESQCIEVADEVPYELKNDPGPEDEEDEEGD